MAPYDFDSPDADTILRASDGKEFRVHRVILSHSSPVFRDMFGLPQPASDPPAQIPTVNVPDPSDILEPFIQYLYPQSPPKITDLSMWAASYTIADKYNAEAVMECLRDMLIPRFLENSPFRVYGLASYWGFEEEAKTASRGTLRLDILDGFSEEDASLIGGIACQKLYRLHLNRRRAAQAAVSSHPPPPPGAASCKCVIPPPWTHLTLSLCRRVSTIPWLTAEELFEEAAKYDYPSSCSYSCRNTWRNINKHLASLVERISDLPQTI